MAMKHYTPERQIIEFWKKVAITTDDDKCWLWTGAIGTTGYGNVSLNGKFTNSHRVAWSYPDYAIPEGMYVCHTCDNRACCNPKHLWIGTPQDNTLDCVSKNRTNKPTGEDCSWCKVPNSLIPEIRERYSNGGVTQLELSKEYNVSKSTIGDIVNMKTHKNVGAK